MLRARQKEYSFYSLLLLSTTLLPYLPPVKEAMIGYELLGSLYWIFILLLIFYILPGIHSPGVLSVKGGVLLSAFSGAFLYLGLHFAAGALTKQLKASPYDLSLSGILFNIAAFFPMLLAREYARSYCIGSICRGSRSRIGRQRMLLLALLTVFMALTEINYPKSGQLAGEKEVFIYFAKDVLPILSRNLLLSVLVFYGGAKAGILYFGSIQLFWRSFPFLPDLSWLELAAIGISYPVLYAMVVSDRYTEHTGERMQEKDKTSVSYIAALLVSVLFAWFCVGVFSVYPSVILTGSMEPAIYPGDVVLIRKLKQENEVWELEEGELINFDRDSINITHRIVGISEDEAGNRSFITKGDNNKSEDTNPVLPEEINGTIESVVPRIGLPVLLLKGRSELPEGVVDEDHTKEAE